MQHVSSKESLAIIAEADKKKETLKERIQSLNEKVAAHEKLREEMNAKKAKLEELVPLQSLLVNDFL